MAKPSQIATRKAILRARGVPEKFIDNLATRRGNGAIVAVTLLFTTTTLAGIVLSISMTDHIAALITPYLYPAAIKSWLFYIPASFQSLELSLGIVGFVFILIVLVAIRIKNSQIIQPHPRYNAQAESLRTLRPREALATIQPNTTYAQFAYLPDDTAFLNAIRPPSPSAKQNATSLIGLTPLLVMVVGGAFGSFQYKDITPEAVRLHTYNRTVTYPFRDTKYAYAICYDTGAGSGFGYHIVFPNKSITLWEAHDPLHQLGPAQVMGRIAQIDAKLQRLHVPIHRMPTEGSFLDAGNDCINHWAYIWKVKDITTIHRLVFGS